jgi:hypothetical protein
MAFGGYVAARLSGTHSHLDAELHGITVWGVAVLLGSVLLAQAVIGLLRMAWQNAGSVVSHAVGGAGAISGVLPAEANPQAMIDRLQQSLGNSGDPTTMSREAHSEWNQWANVPRPPFALILQRRNYCTGVTHPKAHRYAGSVPYTHAIRGQFPLGPVILRGSRGRAPASPPCTSGCQRGHALSENCGRLEKAHRGCDSCDFPDHSPLAALLLR